jgi:tyrosyl-DNA phosphodiesterase-1
VPGHHFGGKLHSYGVNRLAALLAKYGDAESQRPDDEIYWEFSSFSRPTPKLLDALTAAMHAPAPLCRPPPRVRPSIVWMTSTEARDSVEGYGAGSCMPSNLKNVREAPREMLRRWTKDGPSSDFVEARAEAAPHIKTYTRYSADGSTVRWSLLTSANLSGYAWGNHQMNNKQLFVGHWELGVLVTPSIIGEPLRTTQGTRGAIVPLPFPCPPRPYADGDVPFSWEERYDEPDRFGSHGTNDCIGKQVGRK